jgi:hypothetical protein
MCPICRNPLPAGAMACTCPVCGEDLAALAHLHWRAAIRYNEGLRWVRAGQTERAIDALRQAVAEGHVPAAVLLGKLYARTGRRAEARHAWERALQRDSKAAGVGELLATLDEVERADRLRRWWQTAIVFACGMILMLALLRAGPRPTPAVRARPVRPTATARALRAAEAPPPEIATPVVIAPATPAKAAQLQATLAFRLE